MRVLEGLSRGRNTAKTFYPENYYFDSFDWDGMIAHLNNKDLS